MSDDAQRISVSRETLRAELAELKLDLIETLRVEMDKKADQRVVESIDARLAILEQQVVRRDGPIIRKLEDYEAQLDRLRDELGDRPETLRRFKLVEEQIQKWKAGTFSNGFERRVREMVQEGIAHETDAGWTRRERVFALIGVIILVLSFAFTVYVSTSASAVEPMPTTTTESTLGQ